MDSGHASALSADLAHLGTQVTPENIVQVAAVLRAEADYLQDTVRAVRRHCRVGEPGLDSVSPRAAMGFNHKITALLDGGDAYCESLRAASDQLREVARTYGHTEQEIDSTLKAVVSDYGSDSPLVRADDASPVSLLLSPYIASSSSTSASSMPPDPSDGWIALATPRERP